MGIHIVLPQHLLINLIKNLLGVHYQDQTKLKF